MLFRHTSNHSLIGYVFILWFDIWEAEIMHEDTTIIYTGK